MTSDLILPGPPYSYPNVLWDSWDSDDGFAGGTASVIVFAQGTKGFFTGTTLGAYSPCFRVRAVTYGYSVSYNVGGGPGCVYTVQLERNGVVVATFPMNCPNAGFAANLGGGRLSAEFDLIPGTHAYGIYATLTGGAAATNGFACVKIGFEVLG